MNPLINKINVYVILSPSNYSIMQNKNYEKLHDSLEQNVTDVNGKSKH